MRPSSWLLLGSLLLLVPALGCSDDDASTGVSEDNPDDELKAKGKAGKGGAAGKGGGGGKSSAPVPSTDWGRDILSTSLEVDVTTHQASATVVLAGSTTSTGASFEAKGLKVTSVTGASGPLQHVVKDGRLDIGVPTSSEPATVTVHYDYALHTGQEGASAAGWTLTWPYFCGNLFPCKSAPSDGLTFALHLTGVPAGQTAIYPTSIPTDAPPYQLAWAVGDYQQLKLGTTKAGTHVSAWYQPGELPAITKGTASLVKIFEWYEQTLGPYSFGHDVGSVSAHWGAGAYGGMEHHPYWHVASNALGDVETHAHEAAHGWFGDALRLRCWEDFVLSEGTTSYLAARAIEAVVGKKAGDEVWASYQQRLEGVVASNDYAAWPASCGVVDVYHDLYSSIPYMKGAHFWRAVEKKVGRAALDASLAKFYQAHRNTAVGMQDAIDALEADTHADLTPLVDGWLRSTGIPALP